MFQMGYPTPPSSHFIFKPVFTSNFKVNYRVYQINHILYSEEARKEAILQPRRFTFRVIDSCL